MTNSSLEHELRSKLSPGVSYADAKNICIAIYCSAEWCDTGRVEVISKNDIARAFSMLVTEGIVSLSDIGIDQPKPFFGHDPTSPEHWISIISNFLSSGASYDAGVAAKFLSR